MADLQNFVKWNVSGRNNTLHQELDILRGIRATQIAILNTTTAYGSMSVPSGKMWQIMRIEFLDWSLTQSFGCIHLFDTIVCSAAHSTPRWNFFPMTVTLGGSVQFNLGHKQIEDFGPYGLPCSRGFCFVAQSHSAGFIGIFWIERDKTDVELG